MKHTFQNIAPSQLSGRQMRAYRERVRQRLFYLVQFVMTDAQRRAYNEQAKVRLAHSDSRGNEYPPHHLEAHVANQGCLFCRIEIAEAALLEAKG